MLKDVEKPKESAAKRAERKWKNHDVATKFKAEKAALKAAPAVPKKPLIMETEKPRPDRLTRFENKFEKEIQAMFDERKRNNLQAYAILIRARKRRLLLEKLRRLEAAQQDEGSNV
jgi:hypothetical protein